MRLVRSSGFWTVLLAGVHVAAAPVVYRRSVSSIVDGGVVAAVDADPDLADLRGAGFWYTTCGIYLGLVGSMVMRAERRGDGAPQGFARAMAVTGGWGVVLSPVSGFWLFLPIAWLARRNAAGGRSAAAPREGWRS